MEIVEKLILEIVKGLVSVPEAVELSTSETSDDKGEILQVNVKVDKKDVGLCIGEGGRNADAIRRVVGLIGFRQTGKRVYVRVDSPRPSTHFSFP